MKHVVVFALLFINTLCAISPPAFPGQGKEFVFNFYAPSSSIQTIQGTIALLEIRFRNTTLNSSAIINENGSAKFYLPFNDSFMLSAYVDDPSTPAETDFISNLIKINADENTTNIQLVPAGIVFGFVATESGEVVNAHISAQCSNYSDLNISSPSDENGAFRISLPEGECVLHASNGDLFGNSHALIRKGEVTTANIFLEHLPEPKSNQTDTSLAPVALAIAFILAIAIFNLYFKRKSGKGNEGKTIHSIIAVLLILSAFADAANVTKTSLSQIHAFDLKEELGFVPNARQVLVFGHISSTSSCNGTVAVEFSDDGKRFVQVGLAEVVSGSGFSIRLEAPGAHRFYTIRSDKCILNQTTINIVEFPDLVISSLRVSTSDSSGEIKTGAPLTISANVSNIGGAFDANTTLMLRFYEEKIDSQHLIGEIQLKPPIAAQIGKEGVEENISWVPKTTGPRVIYAHINDYPELKGAESSEENNWASTGVFVNPGASESRKAVVVVSTHPSFIELGSTVREQILLQASYIDSLTQQPILNANCTAHAPSFSETDIPLYSNGTDYMAVLNTSNLGIGVYGFSVSCSREGYIPSSSSGFIPFITSGSHIVDLIQSNDAANGLMTISAQALGAPKGLRVIVERFSKDDIGIRADSVKINNYQSIQFFTDGFQDNGRYWLKEGATRAEWLFDIDSIQSDTLSIKFDYALGRNTSGSPRVSVRLVPVSGTCFRKKPEVFLTPAAQSGEVATPLYFQLTVINRDSEECGPSTFSFSVPAPRAGWRYEFFPSQIVVSPGKVNSSIITVTSPEGELPGDYLFKIDANSSVGLWASESETAQASATYTVSSPRKRSFLNVSVDGISPLIFTARYTDYEGNKIGTCKLYSPLVGEKSIEMFAGDNSFKLIVPTDSILPGNYPYIISCEAQGFNTKTFTGNVSISKGPTIKRPRLEITPIAQSPSDNKPASFAIHIIPEGCMYNTIKLIVQPPQGFNASLDRDTAPGCGETVATLLLTPVGARATFPVWGSVTASAPDTQTATAYFIINPPGQHAETVSCASGKALESSSNFALSGDPCWNWNDAQTYNITANASNRLFITGKTFLSNCTSPIIIKIGNESASNTIASIPANNSNWFNYAFSGHVFTNLSIASACLIGASAVTITFPQEEALPDLFIPSAVFNARLTEGVEEDVIVTIRNSGATTYSSYTVSVGIVDSDGTKTTLATKTIYSHAGGADKEVEIRFIPPAQGRYTLFFKADSAGEILESNESNNELSVGIVEIVRQANKLHISHQINKGWNVIPFINGAKYTHTCFLTDAAAFNPSDNSFMPLNTSTLSFQSPSDAQIFTEQHGTSLRPKTCAALGGAWVFSQAQCQVSIDAPVAPETGQRTLSKGFIFFTVLPQDAGNTINNLLSGCNSSLIAEWDSNLQEWRQLPDTTPLTAQDAGRVLLLDVHGECAVR